VAISDFLDPRDRARLCPNSMLSQLPSQPSTQFSQISQFSQTTSTSSRPSFRWTRSAWGLERQSGRWRSAGVIGDPEAIIDAPPSAAPKPQRSPHSQPETITLAATRLKQTVKGTLSRSDRYWAGSYIDEYRLKRLTPGQSVQISLKSRALDAYLRLVDARTDKVLLYGEDSSSDNLAPRLAFTAKAGVQYVLRVSSSPQMDSASGRSFNLSTFSATGTYTLQVQPLPTSVDFNFFYGSGLVDAATAVSRAIGLSSLPNKTLLQPQGDALKSDPLVATPSDRWRLDLIKASAAWAQGYTGQGVIVAVLDGGVDYTHPELQRNIWTNPHEIPDNGIDDDHNGFIDDVHGWDFIHQSNDPNDSPYDGHGTHVAGIIAAANNGVGITGVAYNAKIMPVKVIEGTDTADETIAQGIRYAVQNGAKVINISLGKEPSAPISANLQTAMQFANQSGVVLVIAAGNRRQDMGAIAPDNPADYAASRGIGIAVGAIDSKRKLAIDSNPAGSKRLPYVVAPGVDVRSTVPDNRYATYSGTSMATPHVAGVVALMLSANPRLTPAQVSQILTGTGDRSGVIAAP
jgi:subtilisin family serine protease